MRDDRKPFLWAYDVCSRSARGQVGSISSGAFCRSPRVPVSRQGGRGGTDPTQLNMRKPYCSRHNDTPPCERTLGNYPSDAPKMVTRGKGEPATQKQLDEAKSRKKKQSALAERQRERRVAEAYADTHKMPRGKCMACGKDTIKAPSKKQQPWLSGFKYEDVGHLDHVHGTDEPRGWLCAGCNWSLSDFTVADLLVMHAYTVEHAQLGTKILRSGRIVS